MSAPYVVLRGVGVDVGAGTTVLDGIDLTIRPGEVVAVVGPNGAGKSTLLGVIAGDVRPNRGTAVGAGGALADRSPGDLARFRAVMLQEHILSFPFDVEDVVRMGRAPWRGLPQEEQDDVEVARAVDAADIRHLIRRRFPTLSGGEKARVSFARVHAQTPRLLLLDEPTAALDIRHQEQVLLVARRLAAGGGAVVVVLHDLALASAHADRIVMLSGGRVAADGPPEAVLTAGLLTAVYEHPVEVLPHPRGTGVLVLPVRGAAS